MNWTVEILAVEPVAAFEFRWPEGTEAFEGGWLADARIGGSRHKVRHGLGARPVYGRERVHTVTWVDGAVQVEGVEADDYPVSQSLVSRLRRPGRKTARTWEEVPAGYEGFEIVEHRREIDARTVRNAWPSRSARTTSRPGRCTPGCGASCHAERASRLSRGQRSAAPCCPRRPHRTHTPSAARC